MSKTDSPNSGKNSAMKLVGGAGLLIALIVLARVLPVKDWLTSFNESITGLGFIGYVMFAGVYIAATVLFIPGSILTLGAGVAFGVVWGTVAVSAGSVIGASVAFLIARYIARDRVASRMAQNAKFDAIDRAIGKQGTKIVLLLRLSPVFPFNVLNYLLGLTRVPFWNYVGASFIGMLPGTVLYVYLGSLGKAGLEAAAGGGGKTPLEYVFYAIGFVVTIIVTVYVSRVAGQALKDANLEANQDNQITEPKGAAS